MLVCIASSYGKVFKDTHRHVKLLEVISFIKAKRGGVGSGRRTAKSPYILQLILSVQSLANHLLF